MIATVLVAGGVIWFLFSDTMEAIDPDAEFQRYINLIFLFAISTVALIVMFVRRKIESSDSIAQQCGLVLVGWAAAEGLGLMGAIFTVWGDATPYIAGLIVLAMTMFVIRIPEPDQPVN